jgi:hypothetical protein
MDFIAAFFTKFKDALITVGWLVAAIGWMVTNNQANKREKRKETRSEVDAICKAAIEVISKCRKYYSNLPSDQDDNTRIAEISFEIKRILRRIQTLHKRTPKFSDAIVAGAEFFDVITSDPFASKSRSLHLPGDPLLIRIETELSNLIDKLEDGFTKAYL